MHLFSSTSNTPEQLFKNSWNTPGTSWNLVFKFGWPFWSSLGKLSTVLLFPFQDSCNIPKEFKTLINHCEAGYTSDVEETADYGKEWKPLNDTSAASSARKRRSISGYAGPKSSSEFWVVHRNGEGKVKCYIKSNLLFSCFH